MTRITNTLLRHIRADALVTKRRGLESGFTSLDCSDDLSAAERTVTRGCLSIELGTRHASQSGTCLKGESSARRVASLRFLSCHSPPDPRLEVVPELHIHLKLSLLRLYPAAQLIADELLQVRTLGPYVAVHAVQAATPFLDQAMLFTVKACYPTH